jgi:GTP-binding protein
MLTDEVKIKVFAGHGGDGSVAFNKIKMSLGPTGGNGGNGGNIFFEGVSDLTALNKYKSKKDYYADNGQNGKGDKSTGRDGKDLFLSVPIGSVIKNVQNSKTFEITGVGQTSLAAKGGKGGRGNFFFRSSVNTSPQKAEKGREGEVFEFEIELRFIADIGLVGLPNAGKSSLLNELTKADVKVANYEFTTLEPNLGVLNSIVIADIPGLIEGASSGRGLGIKFLKHISRTKILLHCLSLEAKDLKKDYQIIRQELGNYDKNLLKKKEIIVFTKADTIDKKMIKSKIKSFENRESIVISIHDFDSLEQLKNKLIKLTAK